jgi:[ribosomal protein S18]-alanine N-acetyltransferase
MISIADGQQADLEGVMDVMATAFDPSFGEAWNHGQLLSALLLPNTRLFLARRQDAIIGFALTRTIAGEMELLMIGVHPDWQRKSVASRLVRHVLECVADNKSNTIFLEVRDGNPAKHWYEKIGFTEIGRRPSYYRGLGQQRFDAITMAYTETCE